MSIVSFQQTIDSLLECKNQNLEGSSSLWNSKSFGKRSKFAIGGRDLYQQKISLATWGEVFWCRTYFIERGRAFHCWANYYLPGIKFLFVGCVFLVVLVEIGCGGRDY